MLGEPVVGVPVAFGPLGVAPLEREDTQLAREMRRRVRHTGRRLGLPVEPVPEETYGPFGPIFAMDQPASSAHTRAALGWQSTDLNLLRDLENIQP